MQKRQLQQPGSKGRVRLWSHGASPAAFPPAHLHGLQSLLRPGLLARQHLPQHNIVTAAGGRGRGQAGDERAAGPPPDSNALQLSRAALLVGSRQAALAPPTCRCLPSHRSPPTAAPRVPSTLRWEGGKSDKTGRALEEGGEAERRLAKTFQGWPATLHTCMPGQAFLGAEQQLPHNPHAAVPLNRGAGAGTRRAGLAQVAHSAQPKIGDLDPPLVIQQDAAAGTAGTAGTVGTAGTAGMLAGTAGTAGSQGEAGAGRARGKPAAWQRGWSACQAPQQQHGQAQHVAAGCLPAACLLPVCRLPHSLWALEVQVQQRGGAVVEVSHATSHRDGDCGGASGCVGGRSRRCVVSLCSRT